MPRSSRIAAPGTARRPRRARTRTSRPSSSGRRAGRRPAAGSPPRRRSCGRAADLTVDPAPARGAHAGGSAGQPAGRRVRRGSRAAGRRAGRAAGRARASPRGSAARARSRTRRTAASDAPPLLLQAARTLEPLDVRLVARHVSRRVERGAVRRAAGERGGLRDVSQAVDDRPRAAAPSAPERSAARRLRARVHRRTPRRGAGAAARGHGVRRHRTSPWRRCSAGAGWRRRPPSIVWDFETCLAVATREVQLARDAGALEVLAVGVNVLGQAVSLGGDFARAARLVAEADAVTEATGTRVAPYGALVLAGVPRPGGRGLRADRRHDRGGHRRRPGHRRPVRALGEGGPHERPRPLRGGARGGRRGERRHARAVRLLVGAQRADRGRQPGRATPSSRPSALARLAEHTRRAATPTGRSASRRARAPC